MNPKDINTVADVARWLKHYVEWNDYASADMMLRAVEVLDAQGGATLPGVYGEVAAERAAQVAKGRDAAHDDARYEADWHECARRVLTKYNGTRALWIKLASVAISAVESIDRMEAR